MIIAGVTSSQSDFGAMLVECVVGIMALIAATALHPGDYFAINSTPAVFQTLNMSTVDLASLSPSIGLDLEGRTGGAALHQYERRPRAGLFRRRYRRGNHHRAVPLQRVVRDRAQLVLHLQEQAGRHPRGRPHARRQLRARRQRSPRRRAAPHHRATDRRPFRRTSLGRQIRRRPQRCIRPAGPHHRTRRGRHRAHATHRRNRTPQAQPSEQARCL